MHHNAEQSETSAHPVRLGLVLAGVFGVLSVVLLWPGHLAITAHEVDVLHALDAAMRIVDGQRQHIDFMTPLGVLSFAPLAVGLAAGWSISTAFMVSNILVCLALLPAIFHVSFGRMGKYATVFGVLMVLLPMGLMFGGSAPVISMSMQYNRWAWTVAILCIVIILVPNARPTPVRDGIILGTGLAALALTKMTFFICLAPVIGIALAIDREFRALAWMLGAGLAVALWASLIFGGVDFWLAYAHDLFLVQSSETRSHPGKSLTDIIASPARMLQTVVLLAAVIALRQSGRQRAGLILLLLAPAFFFITYQNWGNDPKWLLLLGFLALIWAGQPAPGPVFGQDSRTVFLILAAVSFSLIAPSFFNIATSPFRNMMADRAKFIPLLPNASAPDFLIERKRSFDSLATIDLPIQPDPQETEPKEPIALDGYRFADCGQSLGYMGKMHEIAADLVAAGHAGKRILFVDVGNPLPLLGDFPRLPGRAPWYYGGDGGVKEAEIAVIPRCPVGAGPFREMMKELDAFSDDWRLIEEATHYQIFTSARTP